ncbi:hypothetical protein L9F63_019832, partial [Diploptera punctata]
SVSLNGPIYSLTHMLQRVQKVVRAVSSESLFIDLMSLMALISAFTLSFTCVSSFSFAHTFFLVSFLFRAMIY